MSANTIEHSKDVISTPQNPQEEFFKLTNDYIFIGFNNPAINEYLELVIMRAFMATPKGIILPKCHPVFSYERLKNSAERMQEYMLKNYKKNVEIYWLEEDGNSIVNSNEQAMSIPPNKIVQFVPVGYENARALDGAINSPILYNLAETRSLLPNTQHDIRLLESQDTDNERMVALTVRLKNYARKSGLEYEALKNNLVEMVKLADMRSFVKPKSQSELNNIESEYTTEEYIDLTGLKYRDSNDLLNKLEDYYHLMMLHGNHKPIFFKLDLTASGGGVCSFCLDDLYYIYGPVKGARSTGETLRRLEQLLEEKQGVLEAIKSGEGNGVIMEAVGDKDISISFVKIDTPPYFKMLFGTDNKVDSSLHHTGNDIYSREKFMIENEINEAELSRIEDTIAAYFYLWCKGNGIEMESIKAGQVFGMDMRLMAETKQVYPIDNNAGRFPAPAYIYAHVHSILGYVPEVILQESVKINQLQVVTDFTSSDIEILRLNGIVMSPSFVMGDDTYVSIIFTGSTKSQAKVAEDLFKNILQNPDILRQFETDLFKPDESFIVY